MIEKVDNHSASNQKKVKNSLKTLTCEPITPTENQVVVLNPSQVVCLLLFLDLLEECGVSSHTPVTQPR